MRRVSSSFRDPSGYVFEEDGIIHRRIAPEYETILQQLVNSGLYDKLVNEKMLLPFEWFSEDTIKPEQVPFVSYPYEWSFSMLKGAALLTLTVQKLALEYGMILKDASAYNVQFVRGKPILIDHLSFYPYTEGTPWVAYRQFCQHFLNPLVLAAYKDIRLMQLLKAYLDGIPANLTSKLLPFRTKLNLGLLMHVKLNSLDGRVSKIPTMSKLQLVSLVSSLESTVRNLNWKPKGGWAGYSKSTNYSEVASDSKKSIVWNYLSNIKPASTWDLGANIGEFSSIAGVFGNVVAIDSDPACVELNYLNSHGCLPLLVDLTNPSPGIGWENNERMTLVERGPADLVMALALIHHLAIGNNLPLDRLAKFLSTIGKNLIVEFVPKEDSQVQRMLKFREDIFPNYTKERFEKEFSQYFSIVDCKRIEGSLRSIYLMEVR